jgi:hypothetical protein
VLALMGMNGINCQQATKMPPRLMAALILTRKDVLGGLNPEPAPVTIFFTKYEIIVDNLVVGEVARMVWARAEARVRVTRG